MSNQRLNEEIIENFFAVNRLVKHEMRPDYAFYNLSIGQVHALIFIKDKKTATMGEIAEKFKITMPTATSLVSKLVEMKLVVRKNDAKDRRKVVVALTKKGEKLFSKVKDFRCEAIGLLLDKLTDEEKKRLIAIMKKLIN